MPNPEVPGAIRLPLPFDLLAHICQTQDPHAALTDAMLQVRQALTPLNPAYGTMPVTAMCISCGYPVSVRQGSVLCQVPEALQTQLALAGEHVVHANGLGLMSLAAYNATAQRHPKGLP